MAVVWWIPGLFWRVSLADQHSGVICIAARALGRGWAAGASPVWRVLGRRCRLEKLGRHPSLCRPSFCFTYLAQLPTRSYHPPPLCCSDGENEDVGEMEGDLDAMGAVDFVGLPPQAFLWAAPPVQGLGAAGGEGGEGGADAGEGDGSSSSSEGEDSEDSGSGSSDSEGGLSSSSSGGSGGEAMEEDEEDEWFPGGDAGAY